MTFIIGIILAISILIQFSTAFLALRLIRVTGMHIAWVSIAIAFFFMALRRCVSLLRLISGDVAYQPDPAGELIALVISVLLLLGVAWIAPLFLSITHSKEVLQKSEERIRHLNNVLKAIRNVNQLIVVEKERESLLQKACDALIRTRGYGAAWIGFLKDGETFTIVKGSGLREDVSRLSEDMMGGDQPSCIRNALVQKKKVQVVDRTTECKDCIFKSMHIGKEALIIRIEHDSRLFGLLVILLEPDVALDNEEVELLKEVASDIGLGLRNIESEEALRESENKIRDLQRYNRGLIEASLDPLVTFDQKGMIMDVNEATVKATGRTREELIGTQFADYFTDPERAYKGAMLTFETGEVRDYELVMKARDGTEIIVAYNASVFKDQTGKVIGVFAAARDITEKRYVEEELKKKQMIEIAYSDILTTINETIDLNTILTGGLHSLMKYTNASIGGVYLYDPDKNILRPYITEGIEKVINKREFPLGEGIPGETGIKKEMIVESGSYGDNITTIVSTPMIFNKMLLGVIITCYRDKITPGMLDFIQRVIDQHAVSVYNANSYIEIQEMARTLENQRNELEITTQQLIAANKIKSEFLTNMSHELRTPLNSVIGFSEILHDMTFGPLNEKQLKYANNILISGKHLLHIINNILDLSKIEAGKVELVYEEFKVSTAINEIINQVTSIASKKNITLNIAVDDEMITIQADIGKFNQILFNLISNAIKFSPDSGSVTVDVRCVKDMVRIAVIDTGIGISKKDQEKIFQSFVQIDSSTSRKFEGTGLGLALVKQFVDLHRGNVWVESEPGKGSTFIFCLPIRP